MPRRKQLFAHTVNKPFETDLRILRVVEPEWTVLMHPTRFVTRRYEPKRQSFLPRGRLVWRKSYPRQNRVEIGQF